MDRAENVCPEPAAPIPDETQQVEFAPALATVLTVKDAALAGEVIFAIIEAFSPRGDSLRDQQPKLSVCLLSIGVSVGYVDLSDHDVLSELDYGELAMV
ncbi:MAG TPA: hypothetical protein VFH06_05055 [Candidatus Saccharimonadales bacterium]|nr:hypothetical protein [Candidatus Saccharimonadales bacterium]